MIDSQNLSRFLTVQLSMFFIVRCKQLIYFIILSFVCQELFWSIFKISNLVSERQLVYFIKFFVICQELFYFSFSHLFLRKKKAQRVGFEPTRPCGQTVFKTASLWPLRYLCVYQLSNNCSVVLRLAQRRIYITIIVHTCQQ